MTFLWRDYNEKDRETVEGWLDAEAVRMTGMDEGFHSDYAYWSEQPEMVCGVNFWAKVFSVGDQPAGVMLLAEEEKALSVMEVLVDPALRGKGLGSAALRELLAEGKTVLGTPVTAATAVIFPDNRPSARAFEKAGFVYASTHPDGDAMYYRFDKFSFSCLRGEEREALLPRLFAILHENMNTIAPTEQLRRGGNALVLLYCRSLGTRSAEAVGDPGGGSHRRILYVLRKRGSLDDGRDPIRPRLP